MLLDKINKLKSEKEKYPDYLYKKKLRSFLTQYKEQFKPDSIGYNQIEEEIKKVV